jgi:hypothetical protein
VIVLVQSAQTKEEEEEVDEQRQHEAFAVSVRAIVACARQM